MSRSSLLAGVPLALLQIAIGWHFLYEGIAKLQDPHWTAAGYLKGAASVLAAFFHWLASDPNLMRVVDFLNIAMNILGGKLDRPRAWIA